MPGWNFADVIEAVAERTPHAFALVQGKRELTWAQLDRRADGVAACLLDLGLARQGTVALCLPNCPEYIEALIGTLKASLVPVGGRSRCRPDELTAFWRATDVEAVVFHGSDSSTIGALRDRVPTVRAWLCVGDQSDGPCPNWAVPYEEAVPTEGRPAAPWTRDGDDRLILPSCGRAGPPRGVVWRQDDLFVLLGNAGGAGYGEEQDLDYVRSLLVSQGRRHLQVAPLTRGASCFVNLAVLARGGTIFLPEAGPLDPPELLATIDNHRISTASLAGDRDVAALLAAYDVDPDAFDLSSLHTVISDGFIVSDETKQGLIARLPDVVVVEVYGTSESPVIARSVSSAKVASVPAPFRLDPRARVVSEDGRDVVPGSGELGLVASGGGRLPLGYYKDPEGTVRAFRQLGDERYVIPGDRALVNTDGTVRFLAPGGR